jgi:acyl carrier protein
MDDRQMRLAECFLAVFPELNTDEITEANSDSVQNWDSVAGVALLAAVEEEFGISIEVDDLTRFNSFKGFVDYLKEVEGEGRTAPESYAVETRSH